ncbi:hypothetical protein OG204_03885 [Streptomyces sp. NBC_01387]|uniref:hypothetical protein n=1 Tax=unclassified Streptomyces TaxID=2593676 RepID=UPI00225507F5|nr:MULTISPECIES: hypothetical protein [unclassified Streptomyces]MCX4552574.1 hypothetical protein [Streptomyces sp. NBC_01500]WSC23922.1 hypothetical protein OIE60_31965 [Streptomyces sp. NBC_01766]WSV57790.1 hypothetical protein OG282_31145 [Streptomyces sp. NBC_01014]
MAWTTPRGQSPRCAPEKAERWRKDDVPTSVPTVARSPAAAPAVRDPEKELCG